jgi:hypothetical protein
MGRPPDLTMVTFLLSLVTLAIGLMLTGYRYSLRTVAARTHHKEFVLWAFPNLFKYAPPSLLCSHSGQTLFECTPQLQLSSNLTD